MKHLFILFIIFLSQLYAKGQNQSVFLLNEIPASGVLLNKEWKWQAGDHAEWASPGFDDANWTGIDPAKDIYELPQISKSGKISWFRLHFKISGNINQQLVLMIKQSGASEFFLDGKLIHSFGIVSADPGKIKSYSPEYIPVSFPVKIDEEQVLAVRYILDSNASFGTHFGIQNFVFNVLVNTVNAAFASKIQGLSEYYSNNGLRVGVFGILGILYFSFFLFYPASKANLYFASFCSLNSIVWFLFSFTIINKNPATWIIYSNLVLFLQVASYIFMLMSVYYFLDQKRSWMFNFLIILGISCIPAGMFIYNWGWLLFGLAFTNLINFDITRLAVKALLNKKKGALIVVIGGAFFLFFWLLFSLQWLNIFPEIHIDFFSLALLSLPVAISIYLGYDSSLTHRSLEQKYFEVDKLSKEKQLILAAQNEMLEHQVAERTASLNQSLIELKTTQAQLIQSEKMASLGELTAGIAHEIQNPLNFVNNFSEVNIELTAELEQEVENGNLDEVKAIVNDIRENEQKINHHGKRADAIVKGMLQHSQNNTGVKEPVYINVLVDEYLRLAYHGMRAKDKSFNANLQVNFDEDIGSIRINPQDISRVLLNLFTNAFYAVSERSKSNGNGYEPRVEVCTSKKDQMLLISVKDNGTGIPRPIVEKIFQPFFTTKPTGQGTGLGLSLAYDIVKAHGGYIKVTSEPGNGSEFIIQLPMN